MLSTVVAHGLHLVGVLALAAVVLAGLAWWCSASPWHAAPIVGVAGLVVHPALTRAVIGAAVAAVIGAGGLVVWRHLAATGWRLLVPDAGVGGRLW